MHPYKIMVVQELSERDYETRTYLSRDILPSIPPTSVTICSDEAHFHLSGMVNKKTSVIGYKIILVNSTNDHFIVRRLPFGVLRAVLGCGIQKEIKLKKGNQ